MSNPLRSILYPKSIALAGATNNPRKMGMLPALSITQGGFTGAFFPINPREDSVLGIKAYKSVSDLPETPDLGILIVPTENVIGVVDEFGRKGTRNLIIVSAGFRELGADGKMLEERLKETAANHSIRFIGPNCLGVINSEIGLNTSGMSADETPGSLGLLSHSGTYVAQIHDYLHKRGVRFSKAISLGNEANIDMIEALEFLGDDEQTRAIALYMEGVGDGRRFLETARKVSEKKPVIAHYSGGTAAGARSSSSHTGAIAGPEHLFDGMFAQAGIVRVHSIEELYTHGWALATQPPLKGNRIGVVTNSGGPGTSMANTCNLNGLDIPRFSEGLQKDIREHLFDHAPSGNPVDVTFTLDMDILGNKIPKHIVEHGEADGLLIHGVFTSGFLKVVHRLLRKVIDIPAESLIAQFPFNPEEMARFPWNHNVPVLHSTFFDYNDNYTEAFHKNNVPVYDSPEKAAGAMVSLWKRTLITRRKKLSPSVMPTKSGEASAIIAAAQERRQAGLDEHQAKRVLASYGVPVTREVLVSSGKEAAEAASSIGYPVALKACHWKIQHKTGGGLMALNVAGQADLMAAVDGIRSAAGPEAGILVQEMIKGKREFMAGMTRFPGFGPAVLFGFGGIFTEIIDDSSLRMAPFGIEDALEMMGEIRSAPLLDEFRGMPRTDRDRLASILCTVGHIALLHPEIGEMDLNPIIINGAEPVTADALILLK